MKSTRRKINVTAKHIAKGKRNNGDCCPVALALKEQSTVQDLEVCEDEIAFYPDRNFWNAQAFMPSRSVKRFITQFDKGMPVKPFSFLAPRF